MTTAATLTRPTCVETAMNRDHRHTVELHHHSHSVKGDNFHNVVGLLLSGTNSAFHGALQKEEIKGESVVFRGPAFVRHLCRWADLTVIVQKKDDHYQHVVMDENQSVLWTSKNKAGRERCAPRFRYLFEDRHHDDRDQKVREATLAA